MKSFELLEPTSKEEAVHWLAKFGPDARILAGGTDLIASYLKGTPPPDYLVDITHIEGLSRIYRNGGLHVGATCTFTQVEQSALVQQHCEMLADATRVAGSRQIRNLGTIGGNICNAVPSADGAAPLLAADAIAAVASTHGERWVPLTEFFRGPRETVLEADELVLGFLLPDRRPGTGSTYQRFSPRRALDLAVVGVAASISLEPTGVVCEARLALGAVAPVPQRVVEAEQLLFGNRLSKELLAQVAEAAVRISKPRTSIRGSAEYKQEIIRVLTRRCLEEAARRAAKTGDGGVNA